jgi:hypothetical protein
MNFEDIDSINRNLEKCFPINVMDQNYLRTSTIFNKIGIKELDKIL